MKLPTVTANVLIQMFSVLFPHSRPAITSKPTDPAVAMLQDEAVEKLRQAEADKAQVENEKLYYKDQVDAKVNCL